ncbi:MAG TPA: hypothetical protein VHI78_05870 [Bacteroidales bacterium]|nr:hypothetical protein [Bacteroidales bacterium]
MRKVIVLSFMTLDGVYRLPEGRKKILPVTSNMADGYFLFLMNFWERLWVSK